MIDSNAYGFLALRISQHPRAAVYACSLHGHLQRHPDRGHTLTSWVSCKISGQRLSVTECLSAVDEDLALGQDYIYVVFNLSMPESPKHRGRMLQPGPWGNEVQAAGIMGLAGHSYIQKGVQRPRMHVDQ